MSEFKRNSNVNEAQVIEVVEVKSIVGEGIKNDPVREIREYWSKDGTLLARTSRLEDLHIGVWTNPKQTPNKPSEDK